MELPFHPFISIGPADLNLRSKNPWTLLPIFPRRAGVVRESSEDPFFTLSLLSSISVPGRLSAYPNRTIDCVYSYWSDLKVFHRELEDLICLVSRSCLCPVEKVMDDCSVCIFSIRREQ